MESPLVIHIAQRPGPATGLPTRTEQADLDLALYAGHGEFPRVIYAPGTLEDAFELSKKAFTVADKYQVPAFILSDQYFVDSYYNTPAFDLSNLAIKNHVVSSDSEYKRYALTDNGISPRAIPGKGDGLVIVDSDEHDEHGHLTESHSIRVAMNDKRLNKISHLVDDAIAPEIIGNPDAETMVICWGSTVTIAREAIGNLAREDVALAYFKQVYPLHPATHELLSQAKTLIGVEGNASSQFARVLKIHADISVDKTINKYNGLAFSTEELEKEIKEIL